MIKLIFPCNYVGITNGYKSSHKAIDMGWDSKYGGPNHIIYAPYDGVVSYVEKSFKTNTKYKTYGNYIKINHGNNVYTILAHLKYGSINVKVGDKVKKGQKLALMGNTGYSFGVHLHYEVIVNGVKQNPLKYTYYTTSHTVGKNTKTKYKPLFLESEDKSMKEDESMKEETNDVLFEYTCTKSGLYKIKLNENERLIIKGS